MGLIISCALSCCCGTVCNLCSCCPASTNSFMTRLGYVTTFLFLVILSWITLSENIGELLNKMDGHTGILGSLICSGSASEGDSLECARRWSMLAVFRYMFSGTIFFGFMGLLMFNVQSSSDTRASFQNGFWFLKFLMLFGTIIGAFFIQNAFFFNAWSVVGLIGSFLFILLQMVLLLDFACSWRNRWVDGGTCQSFGLLFFTAGFFAAAFVLTAFLFKYWDLPGCKTNTFVIAFNLVLLILFSFMSILGRVQQRVPTSGLFQSSLIAFYTTYLTWSAVVNVQGDCQPTSSIHQNSVATLVVGLLISVPVVLYGSLRRSSESHMGKIMTVENASEDISVSKDDDNRLQTVIDDETSTVQYNWCLLHIFLTLGCLYFMMVITNWTSTTETFPNGSYTNEYLISHSSAGYWVQIVASWLCSVLYMWSMGAPICFPDRDFR